MFCSNCGTEITAEARFCANCGAKVEALTTTVPTDTSGMPATNAASSAAIWKSPIVILGGGFIALVIFLILYGVVTNPNFRLLGKSFDQLAPAEATRALGVCTAYHSTVKNDLGSISDQVGSLMYKPNVRGNLIEMGQDWTTRRFHF